MAGEFNWIDYYSEFATKLLAFKRDRTGLIRKLRNVYDAIGMKMPTLERTEVPFDIDPFTVFGMFTKGIKNENRMRIMSGMKKEFDLSSDVPQGFDGIPVLMNLKATFYRFEGEREENDIDRLWELFEAAIRFSDSETDETRRAFCECYDLVCKQHGIKWNITIGLYWIRPYTFLSLDSTIKSFLSVPAHLSDGIAERISALKKLPTSEEYLRLRDQCLQALKTGGFSYTTFPALSYAAWCALQTRELPIEDAPPMIRAAAQEKTGLGDGDVETARYWLYAPGEGAYMWQPFYAEGIMAIGWPELGDLSAYGGKEEIRQKLQKLYGSDSSFKNDVHALWQFAKEMKPGDVVFAKKGMSEILGRGIVASGYEYRKDGDKDFPNVRCVKWTQIGSWRMEKKISQKTLTDITDYTDLIRRISECIEAGTEESKEFEIPVPRYPVYTRADFLSEVYMSPQDYDSLVGLLRNKKNVILQGAPGVGKTYAAKRLAYSVIGVKDVERVKMVQFHQSYSYEDFIMGFRPAENGFVLKKGVFYEFCKQAEEDSENDYFFIIDEINRGNLSRIFGELFMLIENDKRGGKNKIQLLYSDELFSVPENVYLIGLMNTADRSLAMLDYALRRRFAFVDLQPGFDTEGFDRYRTALDNSSFDALIQCVEQLNESIAADENLGEGFRIGHSFFCGLEAASPIGERLSDIVEYELIPMLKEYWFDEPNRVREWSDALRSAVR